MEKVIAKHETNDSVFSPQERVKVPMPAPQVLPLMWYIFEASYATLVTCGVLSKFQAWASQSSEIHEQALEL